MSDVIACRFQLRDLSVLTYANNFTHWHYRTDAPGYACMPGYFDAARDMVSVGDVITVSGAGGARILCVVSKDDQVVTVGVS